MLRRLAIVVLVVAPLALGQKAGTHERTLEMGDQERAYLVHVPKGYDGKKSVPLVLMLHGRGSSGRQAASRYYGWKPLSEKHGFVVAFPDALGRPRSWKPAWGGRKTADGRFLARLIDTVGEEFKIDTDRVFMTGHSSGGIMSFSFAATHSGKVAAIAPVAGTIGTDTRGRTFTVPKPKGPVPAVIFHGMSDNVVPYDKERGKNAAYNMLVSAPKSAQFFAKANGCEDKPKRKDINDGKVHVDTWTGGKAPVVFYSIEGHGHSWPTKRKGGLNATEIAWGFFARQAGKKPREKQPVR
ncbi:MAG: hypothetical protein CMJ83_03010 [Planctomycetes bacterium]|nr:hypothetical protein [Planctomycetota bacterium]